MGPAPGKVPRPAVTARKWRFQWENHREMIYKEALNTDPTVNVYSRVISLYAGWWCNNHLEKYESQLGMIIPYDPNHQPVCLIMSYLIILSDYTPTYLPVYLPVYLSCLALPCFIFITLYPLPKSLSETESYPICLK
jgi:hypothetical protein